MRGTGELKVRERAAESELGLSSVRVDDADRACRVVQQVDPRAADAQVPVLHVVRARGQHGGGGHGVCAVGAVES